MKYKVPDHWYPSKLEDRARVDECLEWTDANLRCGATGYFYNKIWNSGLPLSMLNSILSGSKTALSLFT